MAGKGDAPRAVNGETFRRNYEAIFGRKQFAAVTEGVAGNSRRERPEPSHLFNMTIVGPLKANVPATADALNALEWCAEWLDTLSDHLRGRDLAGEMLADLSKTRRANAALDEAFDRVGWTRDAEANFFKARLTEEGEE